MKTNLKKSLAIAGVLAAMMAGSAFAATNSDKDNLPPPPPPGQSPGQLTGHYPPPQAPGPAGVGGNWPAR